MLNKFTSLFMFQEGFCDAYICLLYQLIALLGTSKLTNNKGNTNKGVYILEFRPKYTKCFSSHMWLRYFTQTGVVGLSVPSISCKPMNDTKSRSGPWASSSCAMAKQLTDGNVFNMYSRHVFLYLAITRVYD